MNRLTIVLIPLLILSSCKYFRGDNCNNTLPIAGTYYNDYDKNAKNLLIIKTDGTFEQIFSKEGYAKKNNGKWSFFEESCKIHFENLKFLQKIPEKYLDDNLYEYPAIHKANNIYFIDHYDISYYRVNNE